MQSGKASLSEHTVHIRLPACSIRLQPLLPRLQVFSLHGDDLCYGGDMGNGDGGDDPVHHVALSQICNVFVTSQVVACPCSLLVKLWPEALAPQIMP